MENLLSFLKKYEKWMIQVLMVMMAIVLGFATIDLGWLIIKDIVAPPFLLLSVDQLLDIFGLFMLVLIGIELLETIMKTYTSPGQAHYEVVLSVAIIAISRKVIILDVKEIGGQGLIGIAAIVLALTGGYFLMKRSHFPAKEKEEGR
ncbi:MAG: phosphate-starvation-inducible PsiE family protein [Thermodesulfobacteriota bacterium]